MRFIYTSVCLFFCCCTALQVAAQQLPAQVAANRLLKLGLQPADYAEARVSNQYYTKGLNVTHVYLQQVYKERDVYNAITNMTVRDSQVINVGNRFVAQLNEKYNTLAPSITPAQAFMAAAQHIGISIAQPTAVLSTELMRTGGIKKIVFDKGYVSLENIPVEAKWQVVNEGQAIRLVWEVSIYMMSAQHWWNVRVDAQDGKILDKNDFVSECNFTHDEATCEAHETHAAHRHTTVPSATVRHLAAKANEWVANTYNVYPFPYESPNSGAQTLLSSPWELYGATFGGATKGWHNTTANTFTYTRGNNVFAYLDLPNDNTGAVTEAVDGGSGLDFPTAFQAALEPANTDNQKVAVTNLFYWCNAIHDILYKFGFDEEAGNFQQTHPAGVGGVAGDRVLAEAQDGGGTNNANFSAPGDGSSGRMQMYVWSPATPDRDSDLDNGVVIHEYGHGLSTRLTGGPANSGCLSNTEQMGEGWSDYLALMLTTDWAASPTGATARPIATYINNGVGIRQYPYSTATAINPMTYDNIKSASVPHGIGTVWCTMLWDMTWAIINSGEGIGDLLQGTGGNSVALQLVIDAMKLQPCSPGFIDGRDAILLADELRYGGAHQCIIWQAFANRGLGFNATQGSSSSRSDGTNGFLMPSGVRFSKTADTYTIEEGSTLSFTLDAKSYCATESNVALIDVLPAELTYVSSNPAGSYSGNTLTFAANNLAPVTQRTATVTATVNTGFAAAPVQGLTGGASDMETNVGWTSAATFGSGSFSRSTATSYGGATSWFIQNYTTNVDINLSLNTGVAIGNGCSELSFWHRYNTESGWDGGMVEISANGGAWQDLGNYMTTNPYTGALGSGSNNPVAGRAAFTGNSGGWIQTFVDLSNFANQTVRIRFRFASDDNTAAGGTFPGWYIDNVLITGYSGFKNIGVVTIDGVVGQRDTVCIKVLPNISLPVNLLSFKGTATEKTNMLYWTLATSGDVPHYFVVERSSDNLHFITVGTVYYRGGVTNYTFTDEKPLNGISYYRLKIVEPSQAFAYSPIVSLMRTHSAVSVYPIPATDVIKLSYTAQTDLPTTLCIYDAHGKRVQTTVLTTSEGFNEYTIDVSALAIGMYLLTTEQGNLRTQTTFIKN